MARPILMPQVGQDLTEGKIVAINVKLGDVVKKGDIVAEVESEKATFDVEAFESGTVIDLPYKVGDTAIVLKPLMMVGEPGEVVAAGADKAALGNTEKLPPTQVARIVHASGRAGSSPLARRLAQDAGIDINSVAGSGPGGAVVKNDVMALRDKSPDARSYNGVKTLQSGSGSPVIFIHGFGADLSAWRPFILHMAVRNPIMALDLPAHGANSGASCVSFQDLVATVRTTLTAAGLQNFHLVGHSVGAAVAAKLAAENKLGVRSLTLISPAGLGPKIAGDFIEGFLDANSDAALKPWLEMLVNKSTVIPGAMSRATFAARETPTLVMNQRKLAAGLFSGNTQLFSIHDALGAFPGPVRVVVGGSDRIIPSTYVETVPAHVAVNRVPDVGHLPQLECAALTARLVDETIRSAG
jgi:pimeloyl-ACP methyl ester carboxylesterase